MKLIIFLFFFSLCGNAQDVAGQNNIFFVYIGPGNVEHDSVLVTTANPFAESSKGLEGRHTKVYYIDQTSIDTLKAFVLRSSFATNTYPSSIQINKIALDQRRDDYKIMGVAPYPLYAEDSNCYKLFGSARNKLHWGSVAWNAMSNYYTSPFYEVKYWGAKKTILLKKYWKPFFSYLGACLEAEQLDQDVAATLKNLGWKPPKPNETAIRNTFSRYVQQWDSIHAGESRSIRFVYIGADTGNHGTVAICADEPVQPTDRPGDSALGKAYVTDWDGLRTLRSWIAKSKYVTAHIDHRLDSSETNKDRLLDKFMIIGASDSPLYVQGENAYELFIQLSVGGWGGVNSSAMSDLIRQINNDVSGRKPGSPVQVQKSILDPYGKLRNAGSPATHP
jgi:hypothetical protein